MVNGKLFETNVDRIGNTNNMIYFELCCLVVGEFFPAHPAKRFVLNGKVKVMLTTVCVLS